MGGVDTFFTLSNYLALEKAPHYLVPPKFIPQITYLIIFNNTNCVANNEKRFEYPKSVTLSARVYTIITFYISFYILYIHIYLCVLFYYMKSISICFKHIIEFFLV